MCTQSVSKCGAVLSQPIFTSLGIKDRNGSGFSLLYLRNLLTTFLLPIIMNLGSSDLGILVHKERMPLPGSHQ